mgnify:FL=1
MERIRSLISVLGLKRDPVASPFGFNEVCQPFKGLVHQDQGGVNSMFSWEQCVLASIAHG